MTLPTNGPGRAVPASGPLSSLGRRVFFGYLRRFPWRDGKDFCYRRLHHRLAPPEGWAVLRLRRGFSLRLDLGDPVQRRLFFFGDYDERREADLISRVLEPGEIFWDVGANLGYFTLLAAARLNHTGQVAAFEPSPRTFAVLRANVALNPFANIRLVNLAATDREGEALLYTAPGSADGRANLFRAGADQTESERVRTVTLDGWREHQGLPVPDIIKLDVEGAELAALIGARQTLSQGEPLLLVEMKEAIFQALGTERAAIQEFLGQWGYRPAGLIRGRWRLCPDLQQVTGRNVLWLKPEVPRHRQKARRAHIGGI